MKTETKTVVVGTTLTDKSDEVVKTGAGLARAMGAALHLVHAFEVPVLDAGSPFEPIAFTLPLQASEIKDDLQPLMDEQIRRLGLEAGGPLSAEISEGPAHRVLAKTVARLGASLAVVGAVDSLLAHALGSTASRLVRSSECPVLVLRKPLPVPPRKVLLPVDLSPLAGETVKTGLTLLAQMAGSGAGTAPGLNAMSVEALTVVDLPGYQTFVPRPDLASVQLTARRQLETFVASLHADCPETAWNLTYSAAVGGPRGEILSAIRAGHPDLVIAGTHGRGGFERRLLGSVAEALVRSCETNVLVVPPKAARPERLDRGDRTEGAEPADFAEAAEAAEHAGRRDTRESSATETAA